MKLTETQRHYLELAAEGALSFSNDGTMKALRRKGLIEIEGRWPSGDTTGHDGPMPLLSDLGRRVLTEYRASIKTEQNNA